MNATTIRELLTRTARNALRHTLVLAGLGVVVLLSMASADKEAVDRPDVLDGSAAIVAAHDCGAHVQDPTHVVVTVDGVTRYAGKRLTDQAIEQAVFGMDHGLLIHGFCR